MRTKYLPILLLAIVGLTGTAVCAAQDDSDYPDSDVGQDQDYERSSRNDDVYGDDRYDRRGYGHHGGQSDSVLHNRVHRALERALGGRARSIGVEVTNGNVYLSGTVNNWRDRRYAHEVAHGVRGVRQVHYDALRVRRGYDYRY